MKELKVAIVQFDANRPDLDYNTEKAAHFISEAKENGADIVLFPECFLTAYVCPDICEELLPVKEIQTDPEFKQWCESALTEDEAHFQKIQFLAKELNIGVLITGFSKGKQYPQNTAWLINRDGKILLKYSKVHTCDFGWERYLENGDSFSVCTFDGVVIGVMICYDREYPESARALMLQGAEIILHPNCCGSMAPRLRELSVRAMENMVGIAMANPPAPGMGFSCAYNPMVWDEHGNVLDNQILAADELFEGILYVNFDIEAIRAYRNREDLGKYRKIAAYQFLT